MNIPRVVLYQLHMSRSPSTIGARQAIQFGSVALAGEAAAISRSIDAP